jgi:pimeloyl-ACP methyl ester carboxylesterase
MLKMMGMATKQARLSDGRRAELLADFRKNDPRIMRQGLRAYLRYLDRHDSPAARLCDAGVPAWVVHAEKGDGGLTTQERSTLNACPRTTLVTIPGTSYFIPNEESERVASLLVDALDQAVDHTDRPGR